MMKAVALLFITVFAGVGAHRGHHHQHHHHAHDAPVEKKPVKKDTAFENEASSLKAMMEGVKSTTDKEAGLAPKEVAPRKEPTESMEDLTNKVQDDHAVDQGILGEAAKMQEMMFKHDSLAPKKKAKKSLVKVASRHGEGESQESRAARYFATHGMAKVGKMLGETMNKDDAAKAAALMKSALKMDKEDQLGSAVGSLDLGDDLDGDASSKANWAKVDELRKKAAFRGRVA